MMTKQSYALWSKNKEIDFIHKDVTKDAETIEKALELSEFEDGEGKIVGYTVISKKDINKHIEKLSDHLILDNQNQWNPSILDKTISNGYIISRGVGYAISNEISLKFKELCQEMIEPFSSAEVMHGPKSLIENSFKLFTISLRDKSGMIVAKDSNQIISLTNLHYEITYDENSNTKLRYNTSEMIELDPIIVLSKFYPWIVNYSFEKGLDPDNPRYLTKVTQTF